MRALLLFLALLLLPCLGGCALWLVDGPYEGQVVDAATGEPITGAVVAMSWSTWTPTVAGRVHECYDSTETLTDEEGVFRIKGKGFRIFSRLSEPSISVLKAGYYPISIYSFYDYSKLTHVYSLKTIDINKTHEEKSYVLSAGITCKEKNIPLHIKEIYKINNQIYNK